MSSPLEPKIAVIIVNWERPQDTLECVRSVIESETGHLRLRILLVDNGSRDLSVAQISSAFPDVTIISLPENLGFAGGYNVGIQQALLTDCDFLLLLNNDTVLDREAIQALCSTPWDMAVPKILYYDAPRKLYAAGARWRRFPPSVVMIGYDRKENRKHQKPFPLQYATGCAFMAKRRVFETVAGFDPDFENYLEDYDFFYRTNQAGLSLGYVPEARVYHKVSQSLGEYSPRRWRYLGRNTVLFYRKGNRLPRWALWSQIVWFTIRETLKGNVSLIPHFSRGIREGFRYIQR
jgi:GT2 family glycosyltransferase